MGTRGKIVLRKKCGKYLLIHEQFDSDILIFEIAKFILSLSEEDILKMIVNIENITVVKDKREKIDKEYQERYMAVILKSADSYLKAEVLKQGYITFNDLMISTRQAKILYHILDGSVRHITQGGFDGCEENVYYIDFENQVLYANAFIIPFNDVRSGLYEKLFFYQDEETKELEELREKHQIKDFYLDNYRDDEYIPPLPIFSSTKSAAKTS